MSDKEKLDSLCKDLQNKIRGLQTESDMKKRWQQFALQGSVQSRKLNSRNGLKF